jgi:creatinine amidohydrolase/Fe(II)-dependent formamide hydrolase-like protein
MTPRPDWNEMTWQDFADGDTRRWIAVLPVAATEQHGPHLPVGVDAMIGRAYLARVRPLVPNDTLSSACAPAEPVRNASAAPMSTLRPVVKAKTMTSAPENGRPGGDQTIDMTARFCYPVGHPQAQ